MPNKPTLDYLKDLKREVESSRSYVNAIDAGLFDLYEQQNPVEVPDHMDIAADVTHSGSSTAVVDECLGYYALSAPTFHMKPRKLGSREESRTTEMEEWLNTCIKVRSEEAGEDVILNALTDVFMYGHGGWVTLYAPDRWLDYPKRDQKEEDDDYILRTENWKRQSPLPLISRRVPINTMEGSYDKAGQLFKSGCYPIRADGGVKEFLVVETVRLRDVIARQKPSEDEVTIDSITKSYGMEMGADVDLWTYYNEDWIAYFCDLRKGVDSRDEYQLLDVFEHNLGETPVVWIEGKTPHQFSLIYPLRKQASQLDRLLSQAATRHRLWGWPTPLVKLDPDIQGAASRPQDIDVEPGKPIVLWKTEELTEAFMDSDSPLSDKLIGLTMSSIQRQSPGMGGSVGDASESGYSLVSRFEIGKSKLRPHELALESALAKDARLCLKILEVVDEPIPIYREPREKKDSEGWVVADPKHVNGYYNVRASLKGVMPQDYPRNALAALQITQPGPDGQALMDRAWAREKLLDVPDSDMVDDKMMLQKLRSHPLYEALIIKQVFSESEEDFDNADIEDAMHKLGVPFEQLPPGLQLAIQASQQQGLSGMEMSPGGGNPAAVIAQQQNPGMNQQPTQPQAAPAPRSTLGQAGMG